MSFKTKKINQYTYLKHEDKTKQVKQYLINKTIPENLNKRQQLLLNNIIRISC